MDNRAEVKDFLASRRARISPEVAGVPTTGSRRRATADSTVEVVLRDEPDIDEDLVERTYRTKYHDANPRSVNRAGSSRSTLELLPLADG